MTIVDGKSRKKTVYPMRAKSDSTKALQKYIGFIRVPPTDIRVDAGGKFCGESATGLIDICRSMCINSQSSHLMNITLMGLWRGRITHCFDKLMQCCFQLAFQ